MGSISLFETLDRLIKEAEISTSPKTFFVHIKVPEEVAKDLRAVQAKVIPDKSKHEDIDHVTLCFTRKPSTNHEPEKIESAVESLKQIGERTSPMRAKIQGWAFFDGASNDGKPSTALVALLDAPGLEHLHVDIARDLKGSGIEPSGLHVFTPHITLGYLGHNGRVDNLPPIHGEFMIDKIHIAAKDHHEVPLTGTTKTAARAGIRQIERLLSQGEQAAAHALAKTPGVLKDNPLGSSLKYLGHGAEGMADLVAHPQHGVVVRKSFYTPDLEGPALKARLGPSLNEHPEFAKFFGETTGPGPVNAPIHFSEYLPGSAPHLGKDYRNELTQNASKVTRPLGYEVGDIKGDNVRWDPAHKRYRIIDYSAAAPGEQMLEGSGDIQKSLAHGLFGGEKPFLKHVRQGLLGGKVADDKTAMDPVHLGGLIAGGKIMLSNAVQRFGSKLPPLQWLGKEIAGVGARTGMQGKPMFSAPFRHVAAIALDPKLTGLYENAHAAGRLAGNDTSVAPAIANALKAHPDIAAHPALSGAADFISKVPMESKGWRRALDYGFTPVSQVGKDIAGLAQRALPSRMAPLLKRASSNEVVFSMNPRDLRASRQTLPGKGETSALSGATTSLQGGTGTDKFAFEKVAVIPKLLRLMQTPIPGTPKWHMDVKTRPQLDASEAAMRNWQNEKIHGTIYKGLKGMGVDRALQKMEPYIGSATAPAAERAQYGDRKIFALSHDPLKAVASYAPIPYASDIFQTGRSVLHKALGTPGPLTYGEHIKASPSNQLSFAFDAPMAKPTIAPAPIVVPREPVHLR